MAVLTGLSLPAASPRQAPPHEEDLEDVGRNADLCLCIFNQDAFELLLLQHYVSQM